MTGKTINLEGEGPFEMPIVERVPSLAEPQADYLPIKLHIEVDGGKLVLVPLPRHCVNELLGLLKKVKVGRDVV